MENLCENPSRKMHALARISPYMSFTAWKVSCSEFFWSVFSRIWTEYGKIWGICIPFQLLLSCMNVFLGKGVLKICNKFTGEHPCRSVVSIKLQSNFVKITLWHGSSPENLLQIYRTPFPKNTSGRLLLDFWNSGCWTIWNSS